jgi:hypothetical protein
MREREAAPENHVGESTPAECIARAPEDHQADDIGRRVEVVKWRAGAFVRAACAGTPAAAPVTKRRAVGARGRRHSRTVRAGHRGRLLLRRSVDTLRPRQTRGRQFGQNPMTGVWLMAPTRRSKHVVVVSAENNPYMAWQSQLLYFSIISYTRLPCLFVVHGGEEGLHVGFHAIAERGGRVVRAPNYKCFGLNGTSYEPLNTVGTLLEASSLVPTGGFIVLCDADLVFIDEPQFEEALCAQYYDYLDYESEYVRDVIKTSFFGLRGSDWSHVRCGVPYVIPASLARPVAERWLSVHLSFKSLRWEAVMYAFGIAVNALGLRVNLLDEVVHNFWPERAVCRPILHYCYNTEYWSKRAFHDEAGYHSVWRPPDTPMAAQSVGGRVLVELDRARRFYGPG